MDTPAHTSSAPAAPGAPPVRRRISHFIPFGSTGRRQTILGAHYVALWEEIRIKWLPTARPVGYPDDEASAYQREHLAGILLAVPEWDGCEICQSLANRHGWRCDADLVAIIHRWSCGLLRAMRTTKEEAP